MRRTSSMSAMWVVFCLLALSGWSVVFAAADPSTDRAKQIMESTGVQGGLVVHVGCGNGKLTAEVLLSDRYRIQGLDADPEKVAAARKHIRSREQYGPVSVRQFDGQRLPYADNLVNLLVVSIPVAENS